MPADSHRWRVPVDEEQDAAVGEGNERAALYWPRVRRAQHILRPRTEQPDGAPVVRGDDLDALDLIGASTGVDAAVHFLVAKRLRLVDDDPARQASRVATLIDREAARHHGPHVGAAQEWVFEVDAVAHVVGDELHATTVRVEHLAAASDELVRRAAAYRIGEPDIGGV